MTRRTNDRGVALLNVLVVVAIGAGLVQGMLLTQGRAISHASNAADRTQAMALATGGLTSVITGLRRDMIQSPEADHMSEAWAKAAQVPVDFGFGSYSVSISDAQARFNVNALQPNAIAATRMFANLLAILDLPPEIGPQIAKVVARKGSLRSPSTLQSEGVDQRSLAILAPFIEALPRGALINLNAADELVLAAAFANPAAAKSLLARRDAKGFIDRSDLTALGLTLPLFAGFRSDAYDVRVTATVGTLTQQIDRRILRFPKTGTMSDQALDQRRPSNAGL